MVMEFLLSDPIMLLFGLLTHYILILMEISGARKQVIMPWTFAREKPYKVLISAIGSIVAYALLIDEISDPSPIMCFAAGYLANDALDRLNQIQHKSTHKNGE